jgi:hypothetical protein
MSSISDVPAHTFSLERFVVEKNILDKESYLRELRYSSIATCYLLEL